MSVIVYLLRGSVEQIRAMAEDFELFDEFMSGENTEPDALVDFDKAWHAVHFVLTGSADATGSPLSIMMGNWEQLPDEIGHLVHPDAVRRFRDALHSISDEEIRRRYDPAAFAAAQIYMNEYFLQEGDQGFGYLMQGIPALRALAERAVENGDAFAVVLQ